MTEESQLSRKRSRLETYGAILEAVAAGARRPTNIMFQANLSWSPLNLALRLLVRQGFLEENKIGKRTIYSLTKKGNDALLRLHQIERDFQLEVTSINVLEEESPSLSSTNPRVR